MLKSTHWHSLQNTCFSVHFYVTDRLNGSEKYISGDRHNRINLTNKCMENKGTLGPMVIPNTFQLGDFYLCSAKHNSTSRRIMN